MYKNISFYFLFSTFTCHAQNDFYDPIVFKANKLKAEFILAQSNNYKSEYEKRFFEYFPNSFDELVALYGFENDTANVLYYYADRHILQFFNSISSINDTVYYSKLINIAEGGKWAADAESYFQEGLRQHVIKNPELTVFLLNKLDDNDIEGFWRFYFDEPHPQNTLPEKLKFIQDYNSRVYNLMKKAQKYVLKSWENE